MARKGEAALPFDILIFSEQFGNLERAKGIEPSYEAWEASVLPLNYARMNDACDGQHLSRNPSRIGKIRRSPVALQLPFSSVRPRFTST
jgi:hypothetical protein